MTTPSTPGRNETLGEKEFVTFHHFYMIIKRKKKKKNSLNVANQLKKICKNNFRRRNSILTLTLLRIHIYINYEYLQIFKKKKLNLRYNILKRRILEKRKSARLKNLPDSIEFFSLYYCI